MTAEDLSEAARLAAAWGVSVPRVVLSLGWMEPDPYVAAVAVHLGLPVLDGPFSEAAAPASDRASIAKNPWMRAIRIGTMPALLIDVIAEEPHTIAAVLAGLGRPDRPILVAGAGLIEQWDERRHRTARLRKACHGLRRAAPEYSAAKGPRDWQKIALTCIFGVLVGGTGVLPLHTAVAFAAVLALAFLGVAVLRTAALIQVLWPRSNAQRRTVADAMLDDASLPVYSILVPLFREPDVLPDLIAALGRLDYPAAKLDVMLVLEAADRMTPKRLRKLTLSPFMRIVTVPDAPPRTKPKALNYALHFARGEYVVVFDAEDRPEPAQLRIALAAFRRAREPLACVQARLKIYNARDGWLTRQFAIEYTALFDAMLPMLARLGLPVPLGGTSNHFPKAVLQELGGWDPFNVTEDADLGLRLARRGLRTGVIDSVTWEEAPVKFGAWFKQRTRWMKGWMQTYLVHTRDPRQLRRELGLKGTIGFHAFTGGLILSALAHPLLYALLLVDEGLWLLTVPDADELSILWTLAWFNLIFGYLASIMMGAAAVIRRRAWRLLPATLAMPLYWMLISAATYRAVYKLITDPYTWEKTPHGDGIEDDAA